MTTADRMSGQEDYVLVPRAFLSCTLDVLVECDKHMPITGTNFDDDLHLVIGQCGVALSAAPASPQPQGADGDCMAAQAYQVLGFLDEVIEGRVGKPSSEEMIRALDYFSDAQFNENFLPWPKSTHPQPSGDGLSDETLREMLAQQMAQHIPSGGAHYVVRDPSKDNLIPIQTYTAQVLAFARAVEARVRSQP